MTGVLRKHHIKYIMLRAQYYIISEGPECLVLPVPVCPGGTFTFVSLVRFVRSLEQFTLTELSRLLSSTKEQYPEPLMNLIL